MSLQKQLSELLYECRGEIEGGAIRTPLSHGFRKGHSIFDNASNHKKRRYVLNLDLEDFFPSFNFGRVRGFFIKNRDFQLHHQVATIIAQIACFENRLPQGSPCSPIISDLIAQILDLRLARVAKKYLVTYSRYADDITISTNQKIFPSSIYTQSQNTEINSDLGKELTDTIKNAGFRVNNAKTRLQSNDSRQLVTGLTVNAKVNIRSDYYRTVRAICHRLFAIGTFYRKQSLGTSKKDETSLDVVEGMLSHIYQIKIAKQALHIQTDETAQKALRELYRQFLFYRRFVALEFPLVICEGITDNIYLKCAIQNLPEFHPKLGSFSDELFRPKIGFFSYSNKVHRHLKITGGTGSLVTFISQYEKHLRKYKNIPLRNPVIVLSDNDAGAKNLLSVVSKITKTTITHESEDSFFRITGNLYYVKTPRIDGHAESKIEDFFEPALSKIKLNGKSFNPEKIHGEEDEYGKAAFAEKVVRRNAKEINFTGFASVLRRLVAVIDDYTSGSTEIAQ